MAAAAWRSAAAAPFHGERLRTGADRRVQPRRSGADHANIPPVRPRAATRLPWVERAFAETYHTRIDDKLREQAFAIRRL